jgi:hypothetical protein
MSEPKWVCKGCGKTIPVHQLTRAGIGVHHYNHDKDVLGDGLLNCGLVAEVFPMSDAQKIERIKEIVTKWALTDALDGTEAFLAIMELLEFNPYENKAAIAAAAGD